MISRPGNQTTRRIIIGFKAIHDVDLSVQAATALAAAIGAEIIGLYVRDENMMHLAGLPFVRAINVGMGEPVPLTQGTMDQALRSGAVICRHTLSALAGKARVKWSFNTEQGELFVETGKALMSGDFLVLDCAGREFGMRFPMEVLRTMPRQAGGVVIAASRKASRQNGPVIAIDDGGMAQGQTVALAARLAKASGVRLEVFVISENTAEADVLMKRARDMASPDVLMDVHRFMPGVPEDIASAFSHFSPSFIVTSLMGEPFNDEVATQMLFRAAKAPVVLLQAADEELSL